MRAPLLQSCHAWLPAYCWPLPQCSSSTDYADGKTYDWDGGAPLGAGILTTAAGRLGTVSSGSNKRVQSGIRDEFQVLHHAGPCSYVHESQF
ncbi:hypothetical protein C2845_PM07G08490 [Panicum miliaceum]|uniref:Uncharacterized protein n=1 Tax=Panicum miliaceum TaxID=4540 RepID=A0A3L6SK89_PANMI|nr:hypothetical protein C2845_PM07G08490 [Panicum miliaceum]